MSFEFVLSDPQDGRSKIYRLPKGEHTLGQAADSFILLEHAFVADEHARLMVTEQAVWLTDLGSQSGTLVDALRLPPNKPVQLKLGSRVEIGWFELTLRETTVLSHPPAPSNNNNNNGKETNEEPEPNLGLEAWSTLEEYQELTKPLGLEKAFSRYMQYLPAIYDTPYVHRFLALLESLLMPIVWRIDNLDFYLDSGQAPANFLPWLANWYRLTFDEAWADKERQQRQLLQAAPTIFGGWGTARALQTVLDIYVGQPVAIVDDETLPPFTFRVEVPLPPDEMEKAAVSRLINQHKPAQTSFELIFTGAT
ncbi:MAG: FHA domain-containing protein [Anaerolineales bacterium]|nr:FHA domain-containing protein [Anaerolineales bacterium]